MKNLFGAAVLAAMTAVSGTALANDTLEATFGNTVTVTSAEGTLLASYHLSADGTFSITTAEGTSGGVWHEDTAAHQICLTIDEGEEACNDLVDGIDVGGSWTDDDGNTVAIIAGM